jgi:hypothetical protein
VSESGVKIGHACVSLDENFLGLQRDAVEYAGVVPVSDAVRVLYLGRSIVYLALCVEVAPV